MDRARALRSTLALAAFAATARAQSTLTLDQSGGGLGETLSFTLTGGAGRPYLLWTDLVEQDTQIRPGVWANVGFHFVGFSLTTPGFLGTLDAHGKRTVTVNVPNDPALEGVVLSFQALYSDRLDATSGFTRLTPQAPGTFAATLDAPPLPIVTGIAAPAADGSITLLDTTLPLLYRYTPAHEEFELVNLSCALGVLSTYTALPDGRILVAGGFDLATGQPHSHALLFDPATQQCTQVDMNSPRAGHAAAVDANGEVLISGGFTSLDLTDVTTLFAGISNTTELFDPATDTFRPAANLLEPKAFHSATATKDGRVMVAGGLTLIPFVNVPFVSPTGYLYDPAHDSFGLPLFFTDGRILHGAALLDDKRILLAGGINVDFSVFLTTGNLADLILTSLATGEAWKDGFLGGSFSHVTGMQKGRALPAVTALAGASALVAGGFDLSITGTDITQWIFEPQRSADLYANKVFAAVGDMAQARIAPVATLLPDGTVLVTGGFAIGAEIYQP